MKNEGREAVYLYAKLQRTSVANCNGLQRISVAITENEPCFKRNDRTGACLVQAFVRPIATELATVGIRCKSVTICNGLYPLQITDFLVVIL